MGGQRDIRTRTSPRLTWAGDTPCKSMPKHGGTFGKEGGIFFSVQHWLNNVKQYCVAKDYNGKTMGEHHLSTVKFGDAHFEGKLEKKDAGEFVY